MWCGTSSSPAAAVEHGDVVEEIAMKDNVEPSILVGVPDSDRALTRRAGLEESWRLERSIPASENGGEVL